MVGVAVGIVVVVVAVVGCQSDQSVHVYCDTGSREWERRGRETAD